MVQRVAAAAGTAGLSPAAGHGYDGREIATGVSSAAMDGEGCFHKLDVSDRRSGRDRRGSRDPDRGVQDWLNDEVQEDRRSGLERRSGISRRGSAANRLDERKVIPFAIAPHGSIQAADGHLWGITLWDLSRSGLCVIANGQVNLPVGSGLTLTLNEVIGTGSLALQARLMWFSDDAYQTYLGLRLEQPPEVPAGSFLERYLKADFDT